MHTRANIFQATGKAHNESKYPSDAGRIPVPPHSPLDVQTREKTPGHTAHQNRKFSQQSATLHTHTHTHWSLYTHRFISKQQKQLNKARARFVCYYSQHSSGYSV